MALRAPGADRKPHSWLGRAKHLANKFLGRLPEKFQLKITYQERHGAGPVFQQNMERLWERHIKQADLGPALGILFFCVVILLVTLGPLGVQQPLQNLWVEFGGLTFDVLFILVIFSLFERGRQRRQEIERQKEIIEDYKSWDSEEAKFRIAGALRRLNNRGIYAIDFSGVRLSDFSFSTSGIKSIRGTNFFDGVWGEFFKDSAVKLERVEFSFVDCREVVFSPFDPLSGIGSARFSMTNLIDCSFVRSNMQGASFNGAMLKWSDAPPDDLYEHHEDDSGQYMGSSQVAYAPFDEADLSGASFANTIFENADFRNAQGLQAADFRGARGLETAKFDSNATKEFVLAMARENPKAGVFQ